jgi:hypothetical protein
MAFLNVTAELPIHGLSTFKRPEQATGCSGNSVLLDLAGYIRSATWSGVAHDTAGTAWGILAPVWLQRQRRIKLLERMMYEVCESSLQENLIS